MVSTDVLRALGQAWRGDWSDFDGRTLRSQIDSIIPLIEREAGGEDVAAEMRQWAENWGLKVEGETVLGEWSRSW